MIAKRIVQYLRGVKYTLLRHKGCPYFEGVLAGRQKHGIRA